MMNLYVAQGQDACGCRVMLRATTSRRPALGLLLLLLILLLAPAAGRAQTVAAGNGFSHFIRPDGTLWGSGFGNNGQVGDGTGTSRTLPVQIGTLTTWQSLASGNYHTEAIQTNGTLWAWGRNDKGELGDGTTTNRVAPVRVGLASNWQSVAVGALHTLAIRTDGTLWAWGRDESGQLGDGAPDTNTNPNPVQIGTDTNWQSVAAGSNHSLAIRTDGTLWAWGLNGDGQLGLGNAVNRSVPTQVGSGTTWQRVAAGPFTLHSVAIQTNGTLWTWGRNVNNQLGDGTTTGRLSPIQIGSATTWVRAVVGPQHTLALRADGSLWGWGNNDYGQLGDGSTSNQAAPVQLGSVTSWQGLAAGNYQTLGQRTDNSVWAWGWNPNGQVGSPDAPNPLRLVPAQVGTALDWASPALGNDFTQARKTNGELWSCGQNISGQLGQGQPVKALITSATRAGTDLWQSTSAGFRHGVGIRPDGSLWAWGQNGSGQLGQGIAYGNPPVPTPLRIGLATDWQSVAAGFEYTLAVRTDGTLWAWGLNSSGQLGDGSLITRTAPVQIGSLTTWQSVAAGGNHSLAIQTNGTLWAWGNNSNGQLGDGTLTNRTTPGQIGSLTNWQRVAAGGNYSLALQTAGSLWAWGLNGSGQLGDGTFTNRTTPVPVATGSTWQAIAVGSAHSVALATDGGLWTTGLNGNGQLGDGSTANRSTLARVGSAAWLAVGTSGTALHTAAVRADGSLWAWGQNNYGQTGQPATVPAPLLVYPLLPAAVVATPGSGAAGSTVTLTGLNLFGATAVTMGGVAAAFTVINNSTITAVVPAGLPASVTITVTTAGGTSTPSAAFAVLLKVVGSSPAANARQAPLGGAAVAATYSEPVLAASVTAGALAVFSGQAGGRKAGSLSVGSSAVSFAATAGPGADFRPGELVQATTTSAPTTAAGLVAVPKAWQFYALAGGSGRANFPSGPAVTASAADADANGVAVADVNEDGRMDLLVPTGTNGQVRVLLGDGLGSFAPGTALTGLTTPYSVTPADLNNDGHLDLLIPSISGSRVLVRLGDGAGNFSAVADLATAADTRNCIAADLNNDGILDVVAASIGGNALYRFLGTGSGTFGAATVLTGLAVPVSLAAGDFDNDGWLDLAVGSYGSNQVALYRNLGTGAGTFGAVAFAATGTRPGSIAVADLDADGLPDVLTSNESGGNGLSYLRNTSSGAVFSFAAAVSPTTGGVANGLQVADLNADGTLDVLLTQAGLNRTLVLTNNGTGTLTAIGNAAVGVCYSVAAADFDNDGDVDFVTNRGTNVQVRLNLPPAPVISGIVPSPGGLGQAITLTGTDFGGATALSINGAAVTLASIISNTGTSLTVRVPNAATASGTVSLTTPSGTGTRAFTLLTPPGNALALDGVDDYVRVADSPSLDFGTGDFTVEAWVLKQAPTVGFAHAVGPGGKWNTGASPGTNEWLLQTTTGGNDDRPSFLLESNSSGSAVTYTCAATNPLVINRWYHLAGVRDGNFLRLYVDGVAQPATALPVGTAVNNVAGRDLLLGAIANNTAAAFFANERLDELRIWNLARTPAQILAGQTSVIAPGTAGLVAYYNFDAGTAATASTGANGILTTLYDLTANNNHGTLTNYAGAALTVGNTASNWVESYAAVRPTATAATAASSGGFTATWTAPALGGAPPGYVLEVAADAAFASPVSGSPFAVAGLSRAITGLAVSSTYYYRVRAEKPSVSGQGSVSNVVVAATTARPVALAQNLTIYLTAAGTAVPLPINANNGSTANGGAAAVSALSLSPSTFTCANVGSNAATLTVTDASGATSTAAVTVTVIDNLAPAMRLPYAPALALANVPEAASYGILYQLDMPANGNFSALPAVPYTQSNAASPLPANPARVAYFMQLTNGSGTKWVWASMDNFAANLTQLGLPHAPSNPVVWRTTVQNLNVASNNGGTLVTGTALGAGRVEMWPSNYAPTNADAVPGASATTYDFGDDGASATNGYSSFQVHSLANAQTVLAYNAWNSGNADDVGIGSQPTANPDWTFANNVASGNYTVKTLYILVPNVAIAATQPVALALDASGNASVTAAQLLTAAATDNCSAVTATVAPSAFTCANVGANAVTLTLTDANGNVSRQTATVTVAVPATPTTTWSGTTSTDWADCRNWSYGKLPDAATHAVIPAGRPFSPSLSTGTLAVADLGIASGASLSTGSTAVLQLSGNFTNDGTVALAGPVQLVGSASQTVGGTTATSFGTVVVNKPAGSVALGRDLAIGTALTMSSGTLVTGSFAVALGSAATLTETETSYVSGAVEATRTLATPGSGSSFGGLGVTLTPAAGSTVLPGSTRVRRTTGSPATNLTNANVGIARYFAITPTVDAGLDVTLTLTYRTGELGAIAENRLRLFRSEAGPTGPWARVDFTTFDPILNTATRANIARFSTWTLGSADAPLPVELLAFAAEPLAHAVRLSWRTASERSSAHFEIERSADGQQFEKIGQVAAQGTTASPTNYAYLDQHSLNHSVAHSLYYRLRQVDADGTAAYSPVRVVQLLKQSAHQLTVFPNPARRRFTVAGATEGASVLVLDALGREIARAPADASGEARLTLPAGLAAGVYLVRCGPQTTRLVVEE